MSEDEAGSKMGQNAKRQWRMPPPAMMQLTAGQHLMKVEVQSIKSYLGTIAAGFQREFEQFEKLVAETTADMDEDVRDRYVEDCAETAHELTQHFPTLAWQTTFVAIYTVLEDDMFGIARILGKHLGISLALDDLKDKGIFAAKKYLESLCGMTFPSKEHSWQEILHYNRLRNLIVHCRGSLNRSTNEKTIRRYIMGKKTLRLDYLDRVVITRQFCFEVLDSVEALLGSLFTLGLDRVRNTAPTN